MTGLIKRLFIIASVVTLFIPVVAQTNDAELWTGAGISKSITKKLSLHFEEQVRFNNNISAVKNVFSETMGLDVMRISIKATTSEKMGFVGREEGVAAYAIALIQKSSS